jgi:hypothetical protein
MLVRLTRAKRWRAGWLLALVYLLCVLAPTISFALPGSQASSPCLTDAGHVPGIVHVHDVAAPRLHEDGHMHNHAAVPSDAGGDHAISTALNGASGPEKAPHSSDGQCCGLSCVTALPAALIDIAKPSAPTARCEAEGDRKVSDNAPPIHYRPPIS